MYEALQMRCHLCKNGVIWHGDGWDVDDFYDVTKRLNMQTGAGTAGMCRRGHKNRQETIFLWKQLRNLFLPVVGTFPLK